MMERHEAHVEVEPGAPQAAQHRRRRRRRHPHAHILFDQQVAVTIEAVLVQALRDVHQTVPHDTEREAVADERLAVDARLEDGLDLAERIAAECAAR